MYIFDFARFPYYLLLTKAFNLEALVVPKFPTCEIKRSIPFQDISFFNKAAAPKVSLYVLLF